jgi:hypothetical protein
MSEEHPERALFYEMTAGKWFWADLVRTWDDPIGPTAVGGDKGFFYRLGKPITVDQHQGWTDKQFLALLKVRERVQNLRLDRLTVPYDAL